jgi:23S rRNA pseudouridine1911/1915/1917 synthase
MQPGKKHNLVADSKYCNQRIDVFLSHQYPELSRSYFQKLIRQGFVKVNNAPVKVSYKIEPGDQIEIVIPPPVETGLTAEEIPLDVLYEDSDLLVINKPAGMVVHPGAGVHKGTLVNALMHHCRDLSGVGGRLRPGIVHRLDKNTSGLLVVAKNDRIHLDLQNQFAEKTAQREYNALVWGKISTPEGRIETFVNRSKSDRRKFAVADQGKSAITLYEVKEAFSFLTRLKVQLKTGRTHQIRIHFMHIHHPVFGDPEYSGRQKQINRLSSLSQKKTAVYLLNYMRRQALHAYRLCFRHPVQRQIMEFTAPLPEDFKNLLEKIKNYEREL